MTTHAEEEALARSQFLLILRGPVSRLHSPEYSVELCFCSVAANPHGSRGVFPFRAVPKSFDDGILARNGVERELDEGHLQRFVA